MIRESQLKAKHDEISTCLTSRKRKLHELYSINFATVNIDAGDQSHHLNEGLASFLKANDLHEGRRFDISSLQLGYPRSTRDDGRDNSTQAAPPLSRTAARDNDTNLRPLSASTARIDGDRIKSSLTLPISSKATRDTSKLSAASAPLSPTKSSIANASIHFETVRISEQDGRPLPDRWAQPHKLSNSESESTHKGSVAPLSSNSSVSAPLEDEIRDAGPALASAGNGGYRYPETPSIPITGTKATSPQTSIVVASSLPASALNEGQVFQNSITSPKAINHSSPTVPLDNNNNGGLFTDATSNVETRPAHSFQGGSSTPEEQLRREEAQSLSAFSPQTQLSSISRPISQGATSDEMTDGEPHAPTSPLKSDVTMKPTSADGSPLGEPPVPTNTLDRHTPGMVREVSKDLMLSQRPPIHIDTSVASKGQKESSTKTPNKTPQAIEAQNATNGSSKSSIVPLPERMTTRVSSGALRQKSVSEILGETPRPFPLSVEKSPADVLTPASPSFRSRQSDLRERERERSKLSTVVFAKQPQTETHRDRDSNSRYAIHDQHDEPKDYLLSLFHYQASQSHSPSLSTLLGSSHKTLTTANHFTDLQEKQMYRITRRIYDMQNTNHWPLRQIERSAEPSRPGTHWDALLGHIKWLRTDFREERKWKLTVAKNLADWCAEWVFSPSERRPLLQIKTAKRPVSSHKRAHTHDVEKRASTNHGNIDDDGMMLERTPDLIPSREEDSSDFVEEDTSILDVTRVGAPAAIFSLAPEDVVFELNKTPVADRLLSELCLYRPWIDPLASGENLSHRTFDNEWNTALLPVSKYARGKLQFINDRLSHKRSRYDYESDGEGLNSRPAVDRLQPEQLDVALFDPENKHIRDRIHAGHAFRPPSEYPMPSQSFFEARQSSQWTINEDDELRRLVREYAYNWSLISSCLSSPSLFSSGPERRTPWECFERWVTLEGLPADMAKTHYFRAYHARLDAAQRTINAANQALQQQHGNNPQIPIRRRTSHPIRVERRRYNKHLAMIHAMSKLAKRRESAAQKQQHVASLAAMRKANETVQPRQRIQTPQEWSRFKYERELKRQEQQKLQIEQAKAAAHAQKAQLAQQQVGSSIPHGARNPVVVNTATNSSSPHLAAAIANSQQPPGSQGQVSALQSSQPLSNGSVNSTPSLNGQAGMRGGHAPQAQMSFMQGQAQQRVYAEAGRVQQEQQRFLQQQRLQNHAMTNGQNGGPSPVGSSNSLAHQNNAAMMASMQGTNGVPSPSSSAAQPATRTMVSPRPGTSVPAQPLSSGMMPVVSGFLNQIKTQRPDLSPDQQKQLANQQLERYRQQQTQVAMQAAAGHGNVSQNYQYPNGQRPQVNGVNPMLNPQMYAQMLRSQQSSQQNRNGMNGHGGNLRPSSRESQPPPTQHRASIGSNGVGQSP